MWKSLLKWIGVAVAEKAIEKVMPGPSAVEPPAPRRRTREEMKEVYWDRWNRLTSIENRTPSQDEQLRSVILWLSKYDSARWQSVGEPLA